MGEGGEKKWGGGMANGDRIDGQALVGTQHWRQRGARCALRRLVPDIAQCARMAEGGHACQALDTAPERGRSSTFEFILARPGAFLSHCSFLTMYLTASAAEAMLSASASGISRPATGARVGVGWEGAVKKGAEGAC